MSAVERGTGYRQDAGLLLVLLVLCSLLLAGCAGTPPAETARPPIALAREFRDLPGWADDNHAAALPALLHSCAWFRSREAERTINYNGRIGTAGDWRPICNAAAALPPGDAAAAQRFYEQWFVPVPVAGPEGDTGLFTGYYEASLNGSWTRTERFHVPLYRKPPGRAGRRLPPRSRIVEGALAGQGLELLWVDDPIDAFFLEIQGSGRVTLPDGSQVGVAYAGQNGHHYYAIGNELIRRGVATREEISMPLIRDWLRAHPDEAQAVMNLNPSYVFFRLREVETVRGAGTTLTPGRSLAVDREHVPLGVPLWLDLEGPTVPGGTLRRLVMAQDTGGAIRGTVRGDLFWGYGAEATERAGRMQARGRYYMLVPRSVMAQACATDAHAC